MKNIKESIKEEYSPAALEVADIPMDDPISTSGGGYDGQGSGNLDPSAWT